MPPKPRLAFDNCDLSSGLRSQVAGTDAQHPSVPTRLGSTGTRSADSRHPFRTRPAGHWPQWIPRVSEPARCPLCRQLSSSAELLVHSLDPFDPFTELGRHVEPSVPG